MDVNEPDVVAEVRAAFLEYEAALVANDLEALEAAFWADERVVRFVFGDVQVGAAAIVADRRSRPRQTGPRRIEHLALSTFGPDAATVFAVFRLGDDGTVVHQSQTWMRIDGGWRVVAAHVSQP